MRSLSRSNGRAAAMAAAKISKSIVGPSVDHPLVRLPICFDDDVDDDEDCSRLRRHFLQMKAGKNLHLLVRVCSLCSPVSFASLPQG